MKHPAITTRQSGLSAESNKKVIAFIDALNDAQNIISQMNEKDYQTLKRRMAKTSKKHAIYSDVQYMCGILTEMRSCLKVAVKIVKE